jgi:thiamine-phosphate pyrophosphorylase
MEEVVKKMRLPIIAIGGITKDNVPEVMKAGAYGIAVISAVCCQLEPEAATRSLFDALEEGRLGILYD